MGQNKRRRIDVIDDCVTGSMGEGLIELEVLSMSGECMLTLNVLDSMLGRDLWKTILDKIPCKPGFSWLCPILQGLCWMKVWNSKDLGVNWPRCRLPTCQSICLLPCVLPTNATSKKKSSRWTELQKWQGLVMKCLPCCTIYPRASANWHLHIALIKDFIMWDYH